MFAMLQSQCPAELRVPDRDKQNTDIHDPDLCQRVQTGKTEQKTEQQIQDTWRLQQLFCGHDKDEPDSHLDLPSGLQGLSEKKKITPRKMNGWFICLCKMDFRFKMHQVTRSKSGTAMK